MSLYKMFDETGLFGSMPNSQPASDDEISKIDNFIATYPDNVIAKEWEGMRQNVPKLQQTLESYIRITTILTLTNKISAQDLVEFEEWGRKHRQAGGHYGN